MPRSAKKVQQKHLHRRGCILKQKWQTPMLADTTQDTENAPTVSGSTVDSPLEPDSIMREAPEMSHDGTRRNIGCCKIMLSGALILNILLLSVLILKPSSSTTAITAGTVNGRLVWKPLPDEAQVLTTIAFGSCQSQLMPQPYWDTLIDHAPDLVLHMGDYVYGDCHSNLQDDPCKPLRDAYSLQTQHASQQGAAYRLSIYATLDDHDYGSNDCDGGNPYKETARRLFADFFDIALESLPDDGVYRAASFGPLGQRLQVIMLDTRYNRSPFVPTGNKASPYTPANETNTGASDFKQDMLGDQQWAWLQARLDEPADLRLVVSSIQVLDTTTGMECWRMLPEELLKLKSVLANKDVLLLSGDRHVGGFYEHDGLVEVTASSWTHTAPFGAYDNCTSALTCDEPDEARVGDFVRINHFGSLKIDWENRNLTVALVKAASSPGSVYAQVLNRHGKRGDAGEVIVESSYSFESL